MTRRRAVSIAKPCISALALLAACANKSSDTKLLVVVWSELAVPSEINTIRVEVKSSGASPSHDFPLTAGDANGLPVAMEFVSPDNQPTPIAVTATGLKDTTKIVWQTEKLNFDPGHFRVLTIVLTRDCANGCTGTVTVSTLPVYDPKTALNPPDAGADMGRGSLDSGVDHGNTDLATDARQSVDAAADRPVVTPDAAAETSADTPLGPDTSPDAPPDLPLLGDTVRDLALADGPRGEGAVDTSPGTLDTGLDAGSDARIDAPVILDVPFDMPPDATPDATSDAFADAPKLLDVPFDTPP